MMIDANAAITLLEEDLKKFPGFERHFFQVFFQ